MLKCVNKGRLYYIQAVARNFVYAAKKHYLLLLIRGKNCVFLSKNNVVSSCCKYIVKIVL